MILNAWKIDENLIKIKVSNPFYRARDDQRKKKDDSKVSNCLLDGKKDS